MLKTFILKVILSQELNNTIMRLGMMNAIFTMREPLAKHQVFFQRIRQRVLDW